MFVKHVCPRKQQSQNLENSIKSYILTMMSVMCEQPLDELMKWLHHHPDFNYCTSYVIGMEL